QPPPMVAIGIRVVPPAVTSRGMREPEMDTIAELIARSLASPDNDGVLAAVRAEVEGLCRNSPLYPERWARPRIQAAGGPRPSATPLRRAARWRTRSTGSR